MSWSSENMCYCNNTAIIYPLAMQADFRTVTSIDLERFGSAFQEILLWQFVRTAVLISTLYKEMLVCCVNNARGIVIFLA